MHCAELNMVGRVGSGKGKCKCHVYKTVGSPRTHESRRDLMAHRVETKHK